ncbi:AAC(3)-I family aminoglycoside N-acetyltransferase [Paremcibacter congregatus]|uniref:AAC(3)-I family aminoglycoside 3-N-acetyltransferase n=1 Tax=Paremcibacter congregatus TaxID=2043170 RepID=A0A2G4YR53_9PROT|nr:AAC(3)-I family aminoglycoside N-acetyltransferase [Paremcibacter congregatus]PHZ83936.1 AAC(3)-I family aminoglycoside 3-N-acetyltransferase [Paremcibacter congregatus]QDE28976.1 AAC(3)-I family aminoglycoside N-acetyltransferase [Paremcibacter congregatus]
MNFQIKQITAEDMEGFEALLNCFEEAFDDKKTYGNNRPDNSYSKELLTSDTFIALKAEKDGVVIGGLAAYELKKFEQKRSEIYIYDLAVSKPYRRKGVASALIEILKPMALKRGAWVIYVQADKEDQPAIELYSKLGIREDVLHFDIPVVPQQSK